MPFTNITYFLLTVALFFGTPLIQAQNKYADTDTHVVKKLLNGDTIYSNNTLEETLSKIPSFSSLDTLYALIDFDSLIKSKEMVTVFVTKNSGFPDMNKEEREQFFSEANKAKLVALTSYYIIPGRVDEHSILKAIESGNGTGSFRTLGGTNLRFKKEGETVYLLTDNGSINTLLQTNYRHSKGFFHITSGLAIPKPQ